MATYAQTVRRGLPRRLGGEPWPPPYAAESVLLPAEMAPDPAAPRVGEVVLPPAATEETAGGELVVETTTPTAARADADGRPVVLALAAVGGARTIRRGLPRMPGGEPWPPAGFAPTIAPTEVAAELVTRQVAAVPAAAASVVPATDLSVPLPFTRTVFPGRAAVAFERQRLSGQLTTTPEPERIGPFTRLQWAGAVIVGGAGLLFAAGMAVVSVRWLLSLEPMQEFLAAYPGEYELPEGAPVGIPPWLGWQHFFNLFLIVLIIRSGLQVRTEKRPSVFWSPRNNGKRKISLNLWFHQSLDLLWVTNGVIFVALLFVTGQWMKIVPTSWAVFPNAISAGLQYVSLDWPTENGWVNYNSLQQLAYFATVFLAAPLAIATGVRMSGIWPKRTQR